MGERIRRQRELKLSEKRSQVGSEAVERQREFAERQEAALAASVSRMTQQVAEATGVALLSSREGTSTIGGTVASPAATPTPEPAPELPPKEAEGPKESAKQGVMPESFDMARPLREEEFT